MNEAINLPRLYEPVALTEGERDASEEARRLAGEGAAEGTLVWGASTGDLDCALVLRPDYPFEEAMQVGYVAMVSLGVAVAGLVSPMTALRYRWPGEVLLNDSRVGVVTLHAPPGHRPGHQLDWLVVGVSVNVASYPEQPAFAHTCLATVAGDDEVVTVSGLLESFGRQFLSWLNRWAESGFEPVRRAWLQRADGVGETIRLALPARVVEGVLKDLNEQGDLILEIADGERLSVTVAEHFGICEGTE